LLMDGKSPEDDRLGQMLRIQEKMRYRHMLNYDWIDLMTEVV